MTKRHHAQVQEAATTCLSVLLLDTEPQARPLGGLGPTSLEGGDSIFSTLLIGRATCLAGVWLSLNPGLLGACDTNAIVPVLHGGGHKVAVDANRAPRTAVMLTTVQEHAILRVATQEVGLESRGDVVAHHLDNGGIWLRQHVTNLPCIILGLQGEHGRMEVDRTVLGKLTAVLFTGRLCSNALGIDAKSGVHLLEYPLEAVVVVAWSCAANSHPGGLVVLHGDDR